MQGQQGSALYQRPQRWEDVSDSLKALYPQNKAKADAVWAALLSKPQGERLDYFAASSEDTVRAGLEGLMTAPPPGLREEVEEAVLRAMKRAKSDKVSISAFSAGHWGHMSQQLGVQLELCPSHVLPVAVDAGVAHTDAFHWEDNTPEPNQVDRYMPYLKGLIPLVGKRDYPLVWLEGGSKEGHLLDLKGHEASLYYSSITGNTDAVIITRDSEFAKSPREGLCVLFELKKVVESRHVYQAACELIVAAVLSPQWQPVVVLTDLAEHWQVFWVNGMAVKHARLPSRPAAVAVITGCVQQAAARAGRPLTAPIALPAVLENRQVADLEGKLRAAAAWGGGSAVNPDLLDLQGMLPTDDMQEVIAHALLRQVSMLPAFSTTQCKDAVASMHL